MSHRTPPKRSSRESSEAQCHSGWHNSGEYVAESLTKAKVAAEAARERERRCRIEDILEASRLERDVMGEVWG